VAGCEASVQLASAFLEVRVKQTFVYVDGFNLYYGAVRGTPYKWLDVAKMCELLLPKNRIARVKYFTARVAARPHDPSQPARQEALLQALSCSPAFEIFYGHFLVNRVTLPRADGGGPITVWKTEEKGSDVHLASQLLHDAHLGRFEVAVLVTNDSDLAPPVRIVREELGLPVGILNPHREHPSVELGRAALFRKPIREGVLQAAQLPNPVIDAAGRQIHKPASW
jgi:hypothetical protein